MKYLKNKIVAFVFFILLLAQASIPSFASAEKSVRVFSSVLATGYDIQVKLEENRYWFRMGDNEWVLLKGDVLQGGKAVEVLFMDVNDNKINDVFVKLFEVGANSLYALFITTINDGGVLFSEHGEVFGSPYLNNQGALISVKHDGPFSKIEKFYGDGDVFYRSELREAINSDLERVIIYDKRGKTGFSINFLGTNITAGACVISERAYLSRGPSSAEVTKAYFVKGDRLVVLDSTSDAEWLKVRYRGKIVTEAWVSQEMLRFNIDDQCGENMLNFSS